MMDDTLLLITNIAFKHCTIINIYVIRDTLSRDDTYEEKFVCSGCSSSACEGTLFVQTFAHTHYT